MGFTREEYREIVVRDYLKFGISSYGDLHRFIEYVSGYRVPYECVCSDHVTPFTYIAYCFFEVFPKLLVIASRGGGKTFSTAILNVLELIFKPRCEIASIGAIQQQADRCYKYTQDLFRYPLLHDLLTKPPTLKETSLANHSTYTQLVGTVSGVNSPHLQKLRADEVELMRPSIIQEMLMIPMSKNNIPANTALVSTRKWQGGIMSDMATSAKEKGYEVLIWCYKEVSERCPIERCGVDRKQFVVDNIYDENKPIEIEAWENCGKCTLLPSCRGDLRRSQGYFKIDDIMSEFLHLDMETWLAQKECRAPEKRGLVYKAFDPLKHVGDFPYNANWPCYIYVDFGTSNPFVALWIQEDPEGNIYVIDELHEIGRLTEFLYEQISGTARDGTLLDKARAYRKIEHCAGDPAQKQFIIDLKAMGLNIRAAVKMEVRESLGYVRTLLRDNSGQVHLHVDRKCLRTIEEFLSYRYPDTIEGKNESENPVDKNNHCMDALRYFAIWRHLRLRTIKRKRLII
jgi:hypothetical protein